MTYEPDYENECDVCGQTPVVTAKDDDGSLIEWDMCGPCMFGESKMLDPDEWNK